MGAPTAVLMDDINKINWWHRIDLGNGITTPGRDDSPTKLEQIKLPENLNGLSVLDIGGWTASSRSSANVAVPDGSWLRQRLGLSHDRQERIRTRSQGTRLEVEDVELDVRDISPERVGIFDLVLFLGVLYHKPHPLLALERVASVVGKQLILETHVDMSEHDRPVLAFYPEDESANDPTNWFGPNRAAVEAMLRVVGFRKFELMSSTPVVRKPGEGYVRAPAKASTAAWCSMPGSDWRTPSGRRCGLSSRPLLQGLRTTFSGPTHHFFLRFCGFFTGTK